MNEFDESLPGLVINKGKETILKRNNIYVFNIDTNNWGTSPRPKSGIKWKFSILDTETKEPLDLFTHDAIEISINDASVKRARSAIPVIDAGETISYSVGSCLKPLPIISALSITLTKAMGSSRRRLERNLTKSARSMVTYIILRSTPL